MNVYSPVHSSIGTTLPVLGTSSVCSLANSFRYYFTGFLTLLFTFPSRYLFTIGHQRYLALESGLPSFPKEFAVSHGTQEHPSGSSNFAYAALTLFDDLFHGLLLFSDLHDGSPTTPLMLRMRKSEILNSKFETNSNIEIQMTKTRVLNF